jgi:hypothetical protein
VSDRQSGASGTASLSGESQPLGGKSTFTQIEFDHPGLALHPPSVEPNLLLPLPASVAASAANDAPTFTPRPRALTGARIFTPARPVVGCGDGNTRQSKPRVVLYMADMDGRRPPLCRPYERPRQPTSISYGFALIFVNDEGRRPEARFQSAHRAQQSGLAGDDCIRHLTSSMRQGLALIADVLESTFVQRKLAFGGSHSNRNRQATFSRFSSR